jgi:hypothetical protein
MRSVAFAVAATNPGIQDAQLESAKHDKIGTDALDQRTTVQVNGKSYSFRARDIFTSEVGVALAVNAGVHAGPGGMQERFHRGLQEYFNSHPKADPTKPDTWKAEAEASMQDTMAGDDRVDRLPGFKKDLSEVPGSYQP